MHRLAGGMTALFGGLEVAAGVVIVLAVFYDLDRSYRPQRPRRRKPATGKP